MALPPVPTTLFVHVPPCRPYASTLQQVEIVYDQLLAESRRKLVERIEQHQQQYEEKYDELKTTDDVKAAEFKRWSSKALQQMKKSCADELCALREDYQQKFNKLYQHLEEQYLRSRDQDTVNGRSKCVHFADVQWAYSDVTKL